MKKIIKACLLVLLVGVVGGCSEQPTTKSSDTVSKETTVESTSWVTTDFFQLPLAMQSAIVAVKAAEADPQWQEWLTEVLASEGNQIEVINDPISQYLSLAQTGDGLLRNYVDHGRQLTSFMAYTTDGETIFMYKLPSASASEEVFQPVTSFKAAGLAASVDQTQVENLAKQLKTSENHFTVQEDLNTKSDEELRETVLDYLKTKPEYRDYVEDPALAFAVGQNSDGLRSIEVTIAKEGSGVAGKVATFQVNQAGQLEMLDPVTGTYQQVLTQYSSGS